MSRTYHGMSKTRLYNIWRGMKARCYNKNVKDYPTYGAIGITVCSGWLNDFLSFYIWAMNNGYNDNLSIERKNNNTGYEPNNCTWIPHNEQSKNRRNRVSKNTINFLIMGRKMNVSYRWLAAVIGKSQSYVRTLLSRYKAIYYDWLER